MNNSLYDIPLKKNDGSASRLGDYQGKVLLVVNVVYVFFDTFGIIDAVTGGGPAGATTTMVYKVYADGRLGGDLGGSAAQSVVLMVIVIALTAIQFRYVERKVQY